MSKSFGMPGWVLEIALEAGSFRAVSISDLAITGGFT